MKPAKIQMQINCINITALQLRYASNNERALKIFKAKELNVFAGTL